MRIGVNTRLFVKGKMDGIAWFAYEVLHRMVKEHPEHEFIFFFDRRYDSEFVFADNVKPVIVFPPARHPFLWALFFESGIRRALKRERIDVFFSPDGWLCLRSNVKTLNVIHDLNFVHYPSFSSFWYRKYYRFFFPRFARRADCLATVSEFSKEDIVKCYAIDSAKIKVTYNGIADDFFEIPEEKKKTVQQQLTCNIPYFVFVGTANKRKNVINILHAFDMFRGKNYQAKLVFAGMDKYWDKEMQSFLQNMQFSKDVIFTGYIPTSQLNEIISASFALLYPSFFEGFGVPIVEAFACGVPVITSNTSAMPEVAGDAALLVNPSSVDEITNAMERLFTDKDLYRDLVVKGKNRVSCFQWTKSSHDLWHMIENL
ncbi:MAG: glycosyltransferase family 4 protein, partial [Bacteroidales bacterium]|nr:glycosyltransferase family 4 protein [Bacteroidales bacterium]